jgi:hypothetical protein
MQQCNCQYAIIKFREQLIDNRFSEWNEIEITKNFI